MYVQILNSFFPINHIDINTKNTTQTLIKVDAVIANYLFVRFL